MARSKKKESLTPEERLQAALVPESEQPYKVPENWCWVKFGYLATDMADGPFGSNLKSEHYTQEKEVRIIQLSNIGENGWREENTKYTTFLHAESISRSIVQPGDLVIAKMMPAGRAIICPDNEAKYILSSDAVKFVPYRQISTKFLLYSINSNYFQWQVQGNTQGITRARTSIKKLKCCAFALPPFVEQQRIVDRIESLFAKLDEAKQKAQDALNSFETRKAAILHKAFTGELTAQWRKEHGVGMESWRTVTFKEVCLKITDGTHHSPVNTPTGEYMYVTAKNIKEAGIDLSNITFVTKDVHDEIYNRCDVQYGDVLYIKDGATTGIATVNTIEKPFSLLSSVAVLRPDKKQIMAKYMVYNLNSSKTKAVMINNMSGNAITRLTLSKIKAASIMVCSLEEQTEIVRILDDLLAKEQQVKEAAQGVLEQIGLMKKSILARAFRGELGTNDPTEESAVELLKQVL